MASAVPAVIGKDFACGPRANESIASPQKERSLFGGLHEDTLKLIVNMVREDGAFVVQLSCKTLHSPVRAFSLCVRKD